MEAENEEAQRDEMMAMESILDPHVFHFVESKKNDTMTRSGVIQVDFHFPSGFTVKAVTRREDKSFQKLEQCFSHMPPLILHFILSSDYPSHLKPTFTLSSTWMDRSLVCLYC